MRNIHRLISSSLFVLFLISTALGQESRPPIETAREPVATVPSPLVTATATAKRVRFVSPGTVVQLRLEVYNEAGQKLFDTELRGGNVLDWHLQEGTGERLQAGSYVCVLTSKSLSGRLSQRMGLVTVTAKKASIQTANSTQLSLAQQQTIGPVEGNAAFTVLQENEAEAITAVTHDGTDGQMTSTKGALTFRTGDLFSGKDAERMRITPEGQVGIGTDKPEATLDVAGQVRASEGFRFADGTTLKAENGKLSVANAAGDSTPTLKAAGTGTQNRLAKWNETGGAGTLTDSLLNESGGRIEVMSAAAGTGVTPSIANPNNVPGFAQFHFYPAAGTNSNMSFGVVPRGTGSPNNRAQFSIFNTDLLADPNNYEFAGMRARGTDFLLASGKSGSGQNRPFVLAAGFLTDNVTNANQLFLGTNGNVGLGTNAPTERLHVSGNGLLTGNLTVSGTLNATLSGNGSGLTNLNASNVTTGTLDNARLGVVPAGNGGTGLSAAGASGNFLRSNGTSWTSSALLSSDLPAGSTNYIQTNPASHQAVTVNFTGLRTEATISDTNVIGGHSTNYVVTGVFGGTVGGGGNNRVTEDHGTVSGGRNNTAGDNAGNTFDSSYATVGGGEANTASGPAATVPGGVNNTAHGSFSFAAGQRAKANHQGSFVWSDSTTADPNFFSSTGNDQFLIKATGGVGININNPTATLHVAGTGLFTGDLTVTGALNATLSGNGSGLTNLNAGNIATGTLDSARLGLVPAGNITTGTLDSARLGVVPMDKGGTGLSAAGAADNFLRSNGTSWTSSPLTTSDIPNLSGFYIRNSTDPQSPGNFNISGNGTLSGSLTASTVNFTGLRTAANATSPNVMGGHSSNAVTAGVVGATIGGGGTGSSFSNRVTDEFGTVGGGNGNMAGDNTGNTTSRAFATVGGGLSNTASGFASTVGGGTANTASGYISTVPGGELNTALGTHSFAAGHRAKALHQGAFVWADSEGFDGSDFASTADGQFLIRAAGGVGIGTNSPGARLHVSGAGIVRARVNSDGNAGLALTLNNQPGWSVATVTGGHFQIFNDAISQNAVWVDAASNNVGVGTTPTSYKLHVNGTVAGVGPYVNASDLRYKRDIRPIGGALSKVLSLRGVTFDWRREEFPGVAFTAGRSVGFIAQEVEQVVPEAVTRDANGFRSVAYSHLTPVLVEAVREQQAHIERQQEQLKRQQTEIEQQRRQIEGLRRLVCRDHAEAEVCK